VECAADELAGPGPAANRPEPRPAPAAGPPPAVTPVSRTRLLAVTFVTDGKAARHEMAAGEDVTLGREPGASPFAEVFAGDDLVGRVHAIITYDAGGTALIRDMCSVNGTYVNDEELPRGSQRRVTEHDRIRLGPRTQGRIRSVPGRHQAGAEEASPS
jgi:pSer/pThr/pTyr-binding forkhead associated (FHA) protein